MIMILTSGMPGLRAPAFFLTAALALSPVLASTASAQSRSTSQPVVQGQQQQAAALPVPQVVPPASTRPTPSQIELSKMIWSTMAAVDHANRSGNYSVLRDISAQGFQIQNNASRLSEIFTGIRNSRIDLANSLLVPPTYSQAPQLVREDIFRVQGFFQIRPISIAFDMHFQWEQGMWKLVGIDLQPTQMATQQAR